MTSQSRSIFSLLKQLQIARYKKKGLKNSLLALVLLFCIVVGGTWLGEEMWPKEIEDPIQWTVNMTLFIHFFCQIGYFLTFLPGYLGNKLYEPYQINKNMKKPWEKDNWNQMKLRTIFYLFLNKGIVFPIMVNLSMKINGVKARFDDFPSPIEVFGQLIFVMLVEDFFFYWYHKISHDIPFLYKFHKIHHQYEVVYSLAAEYTHPIDYLFGVLIPSALPFIILGSRTHCFMLLFWQIWKIYISSEGHSGFQFPWSPTRILPFVSGPSYHDFHHSQNIGNFAGSVYLWDTINKSNNEYFKIFLKEVHEEDKQKNK